MTTFNSARSLPENLSALVIGGSGGIGRSVCLALAAAGVRLSIHGRSGIKLNGLAAELDQAAPTLLEADLSEGILPEALAAEARLCDILVVAYGPFVYKTLAETSAEDWRTLALADLALPGTLVSIAAPEMAARGFGRILLFGGTRTEMPRGFRQNAAYAAAKTGLGVIARSVATEFALGNVACTVICPGLVDTEYLSPASRYRFSGLSPTGRLIEPGRLASFAVELLLGDMILVNGSVINADEGLNLGQ